MMKKRQFKDLNINIEIFSGVSAQDRLFFTKHLATMMRAGIPISEALETLIDQTKNDRFKKIISGVLDDIRNGKRLADALRKHPRVFDDFYVSLIEIAEESGTLDASLEFLSKQLSKGYALRKKVQSALMYPGIVVTVTILMGTFISLYVLPQLVDFFGSFDIDLPFTTRILVTFSAIMKSYGIVIFASLFLIALAIFLLTRNPKIRPYWHSLLLKVPIVGKLIAYGQLAQLTRNLGTLIKSGVPVPRSMEITARTLSNTRFRKDLGDITSALDKGKNIGDTMSRYPVFPPIVSKMVSVGEKTGKLDETLLYLGDFYEEEVDDISKNLSTILEPILLLFIGLAVGFVALSIISPIYQLTGSIHQ